MGVSPASVSDAIETFWYWNSGRFLPVPPADLGLLVAEPIAADHGGTAASPQERGLERSWLGSAAASPEPAVRAAVLRVFGGLGAAGDGLPLLLVGLGDPSPIVQQAAALALGEHGGTAARFALVRTLGDPASDELLRSCAALGLGIASRVEGVVPARELRRAAAAGLPQLCEAACAAAVLAGCLELKDELRRELQSRRARELPAASIPCAVVGEERDAAVGFLRPWLASPDDDLRFAALTVAARGGSLDATGMRAALRRPDSLDTVRGLLVAASCPEFSQLAKEYAQTARAAFGFALATNACELGLAKAWQPVAAVEREHHVAEERPIWLLAAALTGDPAAASRAQLVLQDDGRDERWRYFALTAAGVAGGPVLDCVRRAVVLDPVVRLRRAAAFLCAHHATDADLATLRHAVLHTEAADERASLLISLGRTRRAVAGPLLRRFAGDGDAPEIVRLGAWRGIAHALHRSGRSPLVALGERGGHEWLSPWLAEQVAEAR